MLAALAALVLAAVLAVVLVRRGAADARADGEPRPPALATRATTAGALDLAGGAADRLRLDSLRRDSLRADSVRADSIRADSIRAMRDPRRIRAAALAAPGLRLAVALDERRLYVLRDRDTVRVVPVGIGMDSTLVFGGRRWNFRTPRGLKRVLGKQAEPVWVPPDWHYIEVAQARGLEIVPLRRGRPVVLPDSSRILVQGEDVGLERPDSSFTPFAADEEVIWEGTLYIPPVGTRQRQVSDALGRYRLDLGGGYLIHGTPHQESIGEPSSHGCMRLGDDDIEWLYEHVPIGTPVYTW